MKITKWYCDKCKEECGENDFVTVTISARPQYRPITSVCTNEITVCKECASKLGFRFTEYKNRKTGMSGTELYNSAEKSMADQPKTTLGEE